MLSGKEPACQCRWLRFYPWVGKIPWRRKWQPIPVFLPGKSHGQRSAKEWEHNWIYSMYAYSPLFTDLGTYLVAQTVKHLPTMRETQVQYLGRKDLLEKEVATHSSILPGKSHGWRSLVGYRPWGCRESDMTEQLHFLKQKITVFSFSDFTWWTDVLSICLYLGAVFCIWIQSCF